VTGRPSIRGSEEQGATFVELFFDLVFVFAVTQVTGVLAHDLTGSGLVRALIIFWLVWWAWTQFTWSLNEADTEHIAVRMITLFATALAFMMAVTVPLLEQPIGWLFPVSYLAVRVVGIGLQWRLASGDAEWLRAVRIWTLSSSVGLVAVIASIFLPPAQRIVALGVAAIADVGAALRAGQSEWRLFPKHFAERHGLFVIIVLGESLIAAGVTAGAQEIDAGVLTVTITAVVAACAFWWTYFAWVKDALEEGLAAQPPAHVGRFARDVYSFAHFPLIFGVVGFAVAIEESVAHPKDPLEPGGTAALAIGVALILGGAALALVRAHQRVPTVRWLVIATALASIPVLRVVPAWVALTLITVMVVGLALLERPNRLA
jgi:low temperature requirement protein LtrA